MWRDRDTKQVLGYAWEKRSSNLTSAETWQCKIMHDNTGYGLFQNNQESVLHITQNMQFYSAALKCIICGMKLNENYTR